MSAIIVDIGQITPEAQRDLARKVRSGELAKWRGHWFPVAGASFGLGPLKNCYGTVEQRDYLLGLSD